MRYILTEGAVKDLEDIDAYSHRYWTADIANRYMTDLARAAEYVAENHINLAQRDALTGNTGLLTYPVRSHHLVFHVAEANCIVIVAVIKQGRDLARILADNFTSISNDIEDIKTRIARGEIALPDS